MGAGISQSPAEVGVTVQYRTAENSWRQLPYTVFPEDTTVGEIATTLGLPALVSVSAAEELLAYVRGPEPTSTYLPVYSLNREPDEPLRNLSAYEPIGARRLYLRYGPRVCTNGCSNAVGLQHVTDNQDGTLTLLFTDGSTALVASATFTGGGGGGTGPPGPMGQPGADGSNGADGNSITSIVDNGNGTITINMTNLPSVTTSDFTGPAGADGAMGLPGIPGASGGISNPIDGIEYDDATGVITITTDGGPSYLTGDIRGPNVNVVVSSYSVDQFGNTTLNFVDGGSTVVPATSSGLNNSGLVGIVDNLDGTITVEIEGVPSNTTVVIPLANIATMRVIVELPEIIEQSDSSFLVKFYYSNPNAVPIHIPKSATGNYITVGGIADAAATPTEWFIPGERVLGFEYTTVAPGPVVSYAWFLTTPGIGPSNNTVDPANGLIISRGFGRLVPFITTTTDDQGVNWIWLGYENTYPNTILVPPDDQGDFFSTLATLTDEPADPLANTFSVSPYGTPSNITFPTLMPVVWDDNYVKEDPTTNNLYIDTFLPGMHVAILGMHSLNQLETYWWVITFRGRREVVKYRDIRDLTGVVY